jgi:hypothetical protein
MTNHTIITDITPLKRRRIALAQLKGRLKIEINTGMKASSRGPSTLTLCYSWGYEGPRNRQKALDWVIAEAAKVDEELAPKSCCDGTGWTGDPKAPCATHYEPLDSIWHSH